jgi:hypothetical protein
MSEPTSDVDETVCWQCRAPANPACAQVLTLYAKPRQHKTGKAIPWCAVGGMTRSAFAFPGVMPAAIDSGQYSSSYRWPS